MAKSNSPDALYKQIFQDAPIAVVVLDKLGRIVDVNPKLFDWLGYEPVEVIGKSLLQLPYIPMASKKTVMKNFALRIIGKDVRDYDVEFVAKDGHLVFGRIYGSISNFDGKSYDLVHIAEVTNLKLAELKENYRSEITRAILHLSTDLHRLENVDVLEIVRMSYEDLKDISLIDSMYLLDVQNEFEKVVCTGAFGNVSKEVCEVGQLFMKDDFTACITDLEEHGYVLFKNDEKSDEESPITNGQKSGALLSFKEKLLSDGFSVLCSTIRMNEKIRAMIVLRLKNSFERPVEITQEMLLLVSDLLKNILTKEEYKDQMDQSISRYEYIFETSGSAMAIMDDERVVTTVNKRFVELAGYSKNEIEGKMTWTKFIHPDDLERMIQYNKLRTMGSNEVPSEYEFRFIDSKGNVKEVWVSVSYLESAKQTIASVVDISVLKEKENQLSEKIEEIEKVNSVLVGRELKMAELKKKIDELEGTKN